MRKAIRLFALVSAWAVSASAVIGQGCAMCYSQASNAGPHAQRSLDIGIIVLLTPCLMMFAGVFVILVRRAHAASAG